MPCVEARSRVEESPLGQPLTVARALALLSSASLSLQAQVPWSSNATFFVVAQAGEDSLHAVYKPRRGERPLWDFAAGTLCLREMAAFVVSEALGWQIVPPTVLREGPYGLGAVQVFIPHDPDAHYLELAAPDPETVQRIVAFDVIVNNADRKSGHVLLAEDGVLWAIDHGVTFHAEPKLRTVIWEYADEPVPEAIAVDLRRLAATLADPESDVRDELARLLSPGELAAFDLRLHALLDAGRFPSADPDRRAFPWPPV